MPSACGGPAKTTPKKSGSSTKAKKTGGGHVAKNAQATKTGKQPANNAKKPAPKKKDPKPKRMSALDAAAQVLKQAGAPMNSKALITAMAERGLWTSPAGKTPHATLYAAILREINTKGREGPASRRLNAGSSRTPADLPHLTIPPPTPRSLPGRCFGSCGMMVPDLS